MIGCMGTGGAESRVGGAWAPLVGTWSATGRVAGGAQRGMPAHAARGTVSRRRCTTGSSGRKRRGGDGWVESDVAVVMFGAGRGSAGGGEIGIVLGDLGV